MGSHDHSPAGRSQAAAKPPRALACVRCQQRKVKCDRASPSCGHCSRVGVACMSTAPVGQQRRRRFPERQLLERLRHYERLLRKNRIDFQPLHPSASERSSPEVTESNASPQRSLYDGPYVGRAAVPAARPEETTDKAKDIYDAMDQTSGTAVNGDEDSDVREAVVKRVWDRMSIDDHLLFGAPNPAVNVPSLHPIASHVLKLWQVYLENVDPLLKVTHTPTLQPRIIDAAARLAHVSPILQALMFSIYCIATMTLKEDDCQKLFGETRHGLLVRYRLGCQQALLRCSVLRSADRECLTALSLYLVSVRSDTDPQSLSAVLGIAIRNAERMGIHNEHVNSKCAPFEAEMRRRLWWALVLFDARISELAHHRATALAPTWSCQKPAAVNDSDLRPNMKSIPVPRAGPTDSLFAVMRSELGDFIRNSTYHLEYTNPALKPAAWSNTSGEKGLRVSEFEAMVRDKYLVQCNLEIPLQFITFWLTWGFLAKQQLLEHYSDHSTSPEKQSDDQRDVAIAYALTMLECDTKLITSLLATGYSWYIHIYLPLPAYIHIVQDLKRRPLMTCAEKCWRIISDNYAVRFMSTAHKNSPFFDIVGKLILPAWAAREHAIGTKRDDEALPTIVRDIQRQMSERAASTPQHQIDRGYGDRSSNCMAVPSLPNASGQQVLYSSADQGSVSSSFLDNSLQSGSKLHSLPMYDWDWPGLDWDTMPEPVWYA